VSTVDVRTPPHAHALVDVTLQNLDDDGAVAQFLEAYRYERAPIVAESDLTRLVRTLLHELKRQVLANASIAVSVDYDDTPQDGVEIVAMAALPSLVLSGPRLREDRVLSTNVAHEDVVAGPAGPELLRRRPPYTVDLEFTITAASERTVELLNLMAAVATFLNRNRWIELQRDPSDAARGTVRWELDADGEFRTQLAGKDDVRAFTCGFVVRGFDVDEGLPLDLGKRVTEPELLPTQAIATGGAP
jgi:hypothetical protein